MLTISELEVRYGRAVAVRHSSLTVEAGELVGLIGANGAGKTSTLHAVMGVANISSGDVLIDGVSVARMPTDKIARMGVGIVPERRRIFTRLTVEDNLEIAVSRLARDKRKERIDEMCERFPALGRYRSGAAGRLSGGEQQQLAIARALVSAPQLLLMDEPSLGLAPLIVDEIFELIEELHRSGLTILLIEQNARRTMQITDRTYVMERGVIAKQFEKGAADDEGLKALYLGARGVESITQVEK